MTPLRIIVGGMVGQFPLGGVAWDYLHYVLALHELGHDVVYHEDTWVWPFDPVKGYPTDDPDYTVRFLQSFFDRHAPQLRDRWHYVLLHDKHFGMSADAFDDFARTADLFLNVSGACFIPEHLSPRCVKAWMDTDPGYNHIRLATRPAWAEQIDRWIAQVRAHDRHLTYAENIHADDCRLPRLDLQWIPTRPVATLKHWAWVRQTPPPDNAALTTVMSWDYFPGKLELDGVEYHGKPPEYEKFRALPRRTPARIALAVGGHKTPTDQIRADGFELLDARQLTLTPESYQRFIADSAGEWSVAKNVFVALRTGWFSTRTACYLAAGRPAVVQDTAWPRYVPAGEGVHAFSTLEQAVAAIDRVLSRPAQEREAAYAVAEQYLSPRAVLPRMLADLGLS
ncbi:MAG: glycosyltransferase family 1 protein [Tepidisphaerales bacterium]